MVLRGLGARGGEGGAGRERVRAWVMHACGWEVRSYVVLSELASAGRLFSLFVSRCVPSCGGGFGSPCFIICCRNLTMTLDAGRMRTCRFPRFSALKSERRQSLSTEILMCLCVSAW